LAIRRSAEHTRVLRQKVVSSAKLRGMSSADIVLFLAEQGITNPRTKDPYSANTINKDLRELEQRWKDEMLVDISDHRARVFAELGEVKAAAWKAGKFAIILRAMDQEVNLLGLNELDRLAVEINLANIFKGLPPEIASQLKKMLSSKVAERKRLVGRRNVIEMTG